MATVAAAHRRDVHTRFEKGLLGSACAGVAAGRDLA